MAQNRSFYRLPIAVVILIGAIVSVNNTVAAKSQHLRAKSSSIEAMVSDYVKLQKLFRGNAIRRYLAPYFGKATLHEHSELFSHCRSFEYAKFYQKYKIVLDNINISPFKSISEVRPNRDVEEILRDPLKIVIDAKYVISTAVSAEDIQTSGKSESYFLQTLSLDRVKQVQCENFETERRLRGLIK